MTAVIEARGLGKRYRIGSAYGNGIREAVTDALAWTPLSVPLALDGRTRTSELLRAVTPARGLETAP